MSTRFLFRANPRVQAELAHDPKFTGELVSSARTVEKHIRPNLPVGRAGGRSVAPYAARSYVGSPVVSAGTVSVEVGTRWRIGHIIEWGSVNNPPYGVLRKATTAAGMRFKAS